SADPLRMASPALRGLSTSLDNRSRRVNTRVPSGRPARCRPLAPHRETTRKSPRAYLAERGRKNRSGKQGIGAAFANIALKQSRARTSRSIMGSVMAVKTTIVGCGAVAQRLYQNPLRELERQGVLRVTGLVDRHLPHAETMRASFPHAAVHDDLER